MKKPELPDYVRQDIPRQVAAALLEDIGDGDITARLIPAESVSSAQILTRDAGVLCGTAWVDEVFRQLGKGVRIDWQVRDGEQVLANTILCTLQGNTRDLLTGERTALNFLQTLSATATAAHKFVKAVSGYPITVLDTRKTLPGLRTAQKYAALCGGCQNHRIGLYDAFLIKENHIIACGSITGAIQQARAIAADKRIIVEVETMTELEEAVRAKPDQIMLDELDALDSVAVEQALAQGIVIELSGSITAETAATLARHGRPVCISSGSISKHIQAMDLSMRLTG